MVNGPRYANSHSRSVYKHSFTLDANSADKDEVKKWCSEVLTGKWDIYTTVFVTGEFSKGIIFIAKDTDAMMFKLKWGFKASLC